MMLTANGLIIGRVRIIKSNMNLRKIKSQGILEYAALMLIVALAMGVMTVYLQRAVSVRMRHMAQELNETNR